MKNKILQSSMFFLALLMFVYYAALMISEPGPVWGFSLIVVFFGFVFTAFFFTGDRIIAKMWQFFHRHRYAGICVGILCALFLAVSAVILGYINSPVQKTGAHKNEYLLVLGGGLRKNGDPSAALRNRLLLAADYMQAFPDIVVIVSGGKLKQEPWPEALTMARFLEEKTAYNEKPIIQEDKSKDTIQNFAFSRDLIIRRETSLNPARNLAHDAPRVLILTNDFHLRRAMILARIQGFTDIDGLAAPCPLLSVPISYLREVGAYWKLGLRLGIDFCVRTISR